MHQVASIAVRKGEGCRLLIASYVLSKPCMVLPSSEASGPTRQMSGRNCVRRPVVGSLCQWERNLALALAIVHRCHVVTGHHGVGYVVAQMPFGPLQRRLKDLKGLVITILIKRAESELFADLDRGAVSWAERAGDLSEASGRARSAAASRA
jgi:hypothetical protein